MKVSRPFKDICQYCFVFINQLRYLTNHSAAAPEGGVEPVDGGVESAATKAEEDRELLLLESAMHVQMARAQCALYQELVALAVADAMEEKEHTEQRYTFVMDYWQNMELPIYNKEQPRCTYYYSPLIVYNLGVVNHVHK
jgi:hypothetical protein